MRFFPVEASDKYKDVPDDQLDPWYGPHAKEITRRLRIKEKKKEIRPIDRMNTPKRNFIMARMEGKTVRAASRIAGVSETVGSRYEKNPDIQQVYRDLMQEAIPAEKIVTLIKDGCEARMTYLTDKGIKSRPDWKARRPYIEMAAKHGGYFEEKQQVQSGNTIVLNVNHIGRTQELLDARSSSVIEATTEADATE